MSRYIIMFHFHQIENAHQIGIANYVIRRCPCLIDTPSNKVIFTVALICYKNHVILILLVETVYTIQKEPLDALN